MRRAFAALAAMLLLGASPDQGKTQKDPPGVVRMSKQQQQTVKLQVARAAERPISQPVRAPGVVAFDEGHVAMLRPLAPARVERLLVQPGDRVQAGQALADLSIPSLVSAQEGLASARAAAKESEAGVAVARAALRRGVILARDGSLAWAEADRRKLMLAQAKANLEAARSRVSVYEAQVKRLNPSGRPGQARLTTPLSGIVASVSVTPGEFIDTTSAAFTVADLSVVLVRAQVPEASAGLVSVSDPAQVSLASGGGRSWSGAVSGIGAAVDAQTRSLPVRIKLANPDGALRGGMFVSVTLASGEGRDEVVVPSSAVQMVGDQRVAFVPLGQDMFERRDLTLGVQRQDFVGVKKGLKAGEQVVTDGSFELKALLQKSMLDGG